MAPGYEDDVRRLHVFTEWWQTFITPDGIFARHDSPLSLVEHRSKVTVYHLDDPHKVLIGEKHDGGYRRLVADKTSVIPMVDALSSGRLPYRFIVPSGEPTAELADALQLDHVPAEDLRWGPEIIQFEDGHARRFRSLVDGTKVYVIAEGHRGAAVVYGGSRVDLGKVGLLRHHEVLDQLT